MRLIVAAGVVVALLAGCADRLQQYRESCWQAGGYVVETPGKLGCFEKRLDRSSE